MEKKNLIKIKVYLKILIDNFLIFFIVSSDQTRSTRNAITNYINLIHVSDTF